LTTCCVQKKLRSLLYMHCIACLRLETTLNAGKDEEGCWVGWIQIKQCACWKARQCSFAADWPYIQAFQMTIPKIIIACALLSKVQHFGLWCTLRLCQRDQRASAVLDGRRGRGVYISASGWGSWWKHHKLMYTYISLWCFHQEPQPIPNPHFFTKPAETDHWQDFENHNN